MPLRVRINWLIDATALLGALVATTTGISLLLLPSSDMLTGLHSFGNGLMMAAVVAHIALHLPWVRTVIKTGASALSSKGASLSRDAKINVAIDTLLAISLLGTIASGAVLEERPNRSDRFQGRLSNVLAIGERIHFLEDSDDKLPGRPNARGLSGQASEKQASPDLAPTSWDSVHPQAAMALMGMVAIHMLLHWRWIVKVTSRSLTKSAALSKATH